MHSLTEWGVVPGGCWLSRGEIGCKEPCSSILVWKMPAFDCTHMPTTTVGYKPEAKNFDLSVKLCLISKGAIFTLNADDVSLYVALLSLIKVAGLQWLCLIASFKGDFCINMNTFVCFFSLLFCSKRCPQRRQAKFRVGIKLI